MRVDFHSHFLPSMDDGARDAEESLKILGSLAERGVRLVCATPHFNAAGEDVASFLARRAESYSRFTAAAEERKTASSGVSAALPGIRLGAEVRLTPGLASIPELDKLCVSGTRRILLELPYSAYAPWMSEEIYNISLRFGIKPLIAHLNRCFGAYSYDELLTVAGIRGAAVQLNVEFSDGIRDCATVRRLLREGFTFVLGCDIHRFTPDESVEKRIDRAVKLFDRAAGTEYINDCEKAVLAG